MRDRDGLPAQKLSKQAHFHSPPSRRAAQQIPYSPGTAGLPKGLYTVRMQGYSFPGPHGSLVHSSTGVRGVGGHGACAAARCPHHTVVEPSFWRCSRCLEALFLTITPELELSQSQKPHFAGWVLRGAGAETECGAQVPWQSATGESTGVEQDWARTGSHRCADLTASPPA